MWSCHEEKISQCQIQLLLADQQPLARVETEFCFLFWTTVGDGIFCSHAMLRKVTSHSHVPSQVPSSRSRVSSTSTRKQSCGDHGTNVVCLVTQCSADRLGHLRELCFRWPGSISAVILAEWRDTYTSLPSPPENQHPATSRLVRWFTDIVGDNPNKNILISVYERIAFDPCSDSLDSFAPYPINLLRNFALNQVGQQCPLLALLDVDCIPCASTRVMLSEPHHLKTLLHLCIEKGNVITLPCFEGAPEFLRNYSEATREKIIQACDGGTTIVASSCSSGILQPFLSDRYPPSYRACPFNEWIQHNAPSLPAHSQPCHYWHVDYEDSFEPFVIVASHLCPPYCTLLEGYGRN